MRLAALGAPRDRRVPMVLEWDAELEREVAAGGGWGAVVAAWGAFADAAAMRDLRRREEGRTTMAGWISHVRADVALAIRGLARVPGFTTVAVLTLAIGLGGSAAIYTLLERVVLDPLPYPDPERLVRLQNQVPGVGPDEVWSLSTAQYVHFDENARTLAQVGLYRTGGGNLVTEVGPLRARTATVTASMMTMLGAEAHLGRIITPADDEESAPETVVLSHGFWLRALGGDPDVVGSTVPFNDVPIEVIGVLEPGLELPGLPPSFAPDIWMPMRLSRTSGFGNNHVFPGIGRLSGEATPSDAEAEIERLTAELPGRFPDAYSQGFFDRYGFRTQVVPLKESVVGDLSRKLWVTFGGVGLVLLIACANVANLFLVRVEGKRRETGIRTALGASRSAIARYLVAEAMTLAALGGALALAVGYWAVPALTALAPEELPRVQGIAMGRGTILFTAGLALAVGLTTAAVPLLGQAAPGVALLDGGRSASVGRERQRLRSALVVGQMALAVTLIVGAALLVGSLRSLQRADTGMEPEGVLAIDLYLSPTAYPADVDLWGTYQRILARVREIPGVVSAGMGEEVPVSGSYGCTVQGFEDGSIYDRMRAAGMTTCAGQLRVTPGYFDALGVAVLEGRALDEGDNADPRRAAVVVSRAFADRFWPGESAIGQGVAPSGRTIEPYYHVVGVVDDVAKASDAGRQPLSEEAIAIYYPVVQNPDTPGQWGWWWAGNMTLVVRAGVADPVSLLSDIRRAVAQVDPRIPVAEARSMEEVVAAAMADVSFVSLLLAIAAGIALSLAAVGLYGVVAYIVSKRTKEIGMRLAIGARPAEVVGSVVRRTLVLAAGGIVVGLPLALLASRVARSLLVGVEPTEPLAYVAAVVVLTAVALVASWLPARRAARVDPLTALRAD